MGWFGFGSSGASYVVSESASNNKKPEKIKDTDITPSKYRQYKKEIDNFSLKPDSDFFDDDCESSLDTNKVSGHTKSGKNRK